MAPSPNTSSPTTPQPYDNLNKLYLAGAWRDGGSGEQTHDVNPYNQDVLSTHVLADRHDVDEAYAAAAKAQRTWAAAAPAERAAVLRRAVDIFDARHNELVRWCQLESGSIRAKAEFEVSSARNITEEAASFPYRMHGDIFASDTPHKENRVYRQPLGVVGVISPWNFPMNLSNRSVAPALGCGNAVVLKPASDTPITGGLLLAKIYEEAGLPEGLLSVLIGRGSTIGDYFVEHPVPKLITFTGSTAVGRGIGAKTAGGVRLKRVALELGGNCPLVVLNDADLSLAVDIAIVGSFLHQGQICMSTNRIIVDASIVGAFTERFVERASKLVCGDPLDPKTDIGPIINNAQLTGVLDKIQRAQEQGAEVLLGGEPDGLVLPPAVFGNVDPTWDIALQESFGPIVPIITAHGEDEALKFANMSDYGLSSAVIGSDVERACAFALKIDTGMTHVNDMTVADEQHVPFGGEKNSGLGRFNGRWVLEEMTRTHWVSVQHTPHPYPF